MLEFIKLPLPGLQTLPLQDRTLKFLCGIGDVISDKVEHSEAVSQMLILMLQIIVAFMLPQ